MNAMLPQWSRSHSLPTKFSASPSSTTKRHSPVGMRSLWCFNPVAGER